MSREEESLLKQFYPSFKIPFNMDGLPKLERENQNGGLPQDNMILIKSFNFTLGRNHDSQKINSFYFSDYNDG
jgi:hypothetical protein